MLVLSREREQSLIIGDDIEIKVVDVRGDKVRLGVIAPRSVSVHRSEVYREIKRVGGDPGRGGASASAAETPVDGNVKPVRLAVLASAAGSTLKNLIDRIAARRLHATIERVIASRPEAGALGHARDAGIRHAVVDRGTHANVDAFAAAVMAEIDDAAVDLVVMAGWMSLLPLPDRWAGRVMNVHPALLPNFGGQGMYGTRVHEAVLAHGCKVSGCTVHFVDNQYDAGPIILQRSVPVREGDTPAQLAARVGEQEREAYPEAIELFRAGKLTIDRRVVRVGR